VEGQIGANVQRRKRRQEIGENDTAKEEKTGESNTAKEEKTGDRRGRYSEGRGDRWSSQRQVCAGWTEPISDGP